MIGGVLLNTVSHVGRVFLANLASYLHDMNWPVYLHAEEIRLEELMRRGGSNDFQTSALANDA